MAQMKKQPQKRKPLPVSQRSQSQQRKSVQILLDKQLSIVLLFVAALILLGFVIYWESDSPAFYHFLTSSLMASLGYIFGRRLEP